MEYDLQQFECDFMKRTNSILAEYCNDYDATLLLNCMMGLLIVPRERLLHFLPNTPMSTEAWGIPSNAIVCVERGKGSEVGHRSVCWFVVKLRNAVAHFHILPIHEAEKVVGFEFWDRSGFRALLTLQVIRQFLEAVFHQLEIGRSGSSAAMQSVNEVKWSRNAKPFTRKPTERVYVVEYEKGLANRCYEITSSCSEYYLIGCDEEMPKDGATDIIVEPDVLTRQAKLVELSTFLARELPTYKRLSIYTNNPPIRHLEDVAQIARQRLDFFGAFNIDAKRQKICQASII